MFKTEDINKALEVLRAGGVILYPTDTIWGIGCDATNSEAVAKIYKLKQREDSKSMLTLIDSPQRMGGYISEIPDVAWDVIELSEKPLTIIFDGAKNLAPNLIATDGTIGMRVTKELFSKELCARLRKPIVSTSANISGQKAPATFDEISEEIINNVDYTVEYRRNDITPATPSSIIKLGKGGEVKIIRQ